MNAKNGHLTTISPGQYKAGLEFMRTNFPCSTKGHCEGCEIDFQALLNEMGIEFSAKPDEH